MPVYSQNMRKTTPPLSDGWIRACVGDNGVDDVDNLVTAQRSPSVISSVVVRNVLYALDFC